MRAIVIREHGGRDKLQLDEAAAVPRAGLGQAVVRVHACGLNHLDIFVRRGMPGKRTPLPFISGGDIAGTIAELGANASGFSVGQRVLVDPAIPDGAIGEDAPGGLAEYALAPAANLIPLPDEVSFDEAAALPIAYGTAWRMLLTRGSVQAGERILILGAAGGVGTACVQIAKMVGCTVYAAASRADKLDKLRDLGAEHLINYREVEFDREVWRLTGKRGVDVVVDYTGQETWPRSIRSLRKGGRLLTCGATTGFEARTDLRYVWVRELTIVGSDGWTRPELEALLSAVRAGRIRPVIDRVLPLAQTPEGERLLEDRDVVGKVIIHPLE
ncbi:MAG TPA: zinc-binding dehydrogenase [bacterium]|nr:zinc-binding dehydrogenase [bacterium]